MGPWLTPSHIKYRFKIFLDGMLPSIGLPFITYNQPPILENTTPLRLYLEVTSG